mgnify:CR=1 FL=1
MVITNQTHAIQAGFLRVKLRHLSSWNQQRRDCAEHYNKLFAGSERNITLPHQPEWARSVFHLYVVRVDDRAKLQEETMKLYKEEGVNPLAGCLPILLQIPIFFALYKVLSVAVEMRHQPFVAWLKDLSAPDPLHILNLFGLLPFEPPAILGLGILGLLLGITMWLQFRMQPASPDPTQQQMMAIMPWMMMFVMSPFAAGLLVYYIMNNLISVAQQSYLYARHPQMRAMIEKERVSAEYAVSQEFSKLAAKFRSMPDSAFATKVNDIEDLARRLLRHGLGDGRGDLLSPVSRVQGNRDGTGQCGSEQDLHEFRAVRQQQTHMFPVSDTQGVQAPRPVERAGQQLGIGDPASRHDDGIGSRVRAGG